MRLKCMCVCAWKEGGGGGLESAENMPFFGPSIG